MDDPMNDPAFSDPSPEPETPSADAMSEAMKTMAPENKRKMILTSIIADIATSEEPDVDNSAEFEALAGTIDPRELPDWGVELTPPSLEGLNEEESMAARVAYGPGPLAKALIMCMPPRAGAAARLGSLQGVHQEAQLLKSLVYAAQCHNAEPRRRRFLFQDKEGLECLLLDMADPVRRCPSEVPHGPEGRRAAALRALGPDATEEEIEQVLGANNGAAFLGTEEDEAATRENAPLLVVRYEHVSKGLATSKERLMAAKDANEDGFLSPDTGFTSCLAESADEILAGVAMLERHASLLTDEYKKHFAASSPNHRKPGEATGYLPSFIVAPAYVRERPAGTPCGNPSCGKEEEPLLKTAMAKAQEAQKAAELGNMSMEELQAQGRKYAIEAKEKRFMVCVACKAVCYCSKECQKAHWGCGHKEFCAVEKARRRVILDEFAEAQAMAEAAEAKQVAKTKAKGSKKKGRGKRDKVN